MPGDTCAARGCTLHARALHLLPHLLHLLHELARRRWPLLLHGLLRRRHQQACVLLKQPHPCLPEVETALPWLLLRPPQAVMACC
jgi:hypothetical protein